LIPDHEHEELHTRYSHPSTARLRRPALSHRPVPPIRAQRRPLHHSIAPTLEGLARLSAHFLARLLAHLEMQEHSANTGLARLHALNRPLAEKAQAPLRSSKKFKGKTPWPR
jgi:hypothetical protein